MRFRSVLCLFGVLAIAASTLLGQTADSPGAPSVSQAVQDSKATPIVSGTWQMSWTGLNGDQHHATMEIKQEATKLNGKFHGERRTVPLKGALDGNQVSITFKVRRRHVTFVGIVDGDKMSGTTAKGISWLGTRQQQ